MPSVQRAPALSRRRDFGRLVARIFCALFAFIGILPVILWGLARTDRVKSWAERETAALIQKELGVTASYTVEVTLWPLGLELNDLEVPDTRGGEPAFAADRISVQPRVFALLGGRVQVGDIEVDRPRIRVRIKDGELTNVAYRLPEASGGSTSASPFTSLSISDAVIDADIEGNLISTTAMDVDVYAEPGPSFEVAVRAAESHIERTRKTFDTPSVVAVDEDVVCQLDLRARYSGTTLLVRRLSLLGAADLDIERGTRPKCSIDQVRDTKRQVALRASQFRVDFDNGDSLIPKLQGNVVMRAPVVLTNRFVKAPPLKGWIGASVDVSFDGRNKLPDVRGKLRGGKLKLEGYRIAKYLDASLTIDRDVINVPTFKAGWADADVTFKDIVVKPFADKPSIAAREAVVERMTFPGLMRDLDVTRKTVVRWDINKATITNVRGTLDPVHIDAEIIANTDDFEIYDKAYNHPARKHMIGVRAATVRAKIGVRPNAFEFYDIRNTFGKSQLTGKLVSIGFKNDLTLVVGGPGTRVAFEDISPLVDIPIAGMSQFSATMTGKASNPTLKGKMRIANLVFGGFPIGDITHTDVFFRPLKVDIRNAKGKKGSSHFKVPHARLDFDADAAVLVTADVKSDDLKVRDFLSMWHFEKDPRFDGLFGVGKVNARVEFDYGGRRDRCGGGYLAVNGDAGFKKLEIFEERYDTGSAAFDFRWMDRDASHLGMAVDIPSMTLTKGSGAVLGSLRVSDGGRITGNVVGTGIPLNTLQALGELGPIVDGYASGLAQVSGTIDDLSLDANVGVSPVGIGLGTLPSSRVALRLRPTKREQKTIGTTKCGRPMPSEFSRRQYDRDEVQGVFTASGSLFGGQVKLSELTVTRQRAKIVAGSAELSKLDLGVFTQLSPALALDKQRPDGELSGLVTIEHLPLEKYEDAKVSFDIADAALRRGGLTARIAQSGKSIRYDRGDVFVPALGVNVETQGGFRARFDVAGQVTDVLTKREVDMSLKLRPIDLSKLVRRVPRVERADGRVTGGIRVRGPPSALRYSGGFKVEGGELAVAGLPSALSKVNIAVVVDGDELRITKGNAKLGGGAVNLSGNAKLGSSGVADARAVVSARNVSLPFSVSPPRPMTGRSPRSFSRRSPIGPNPSNARPIESKRS